MTSTTERNPDKFALLVVDVQNAAVEYKPYRGETVLQNIARLIDACRNKNIEVIHVQHDDGPGTSCEKGTEGWEIHESVAPAPGEKVVGKQFNSAFRQTDLEDHLEQRGIRKLIVVGIQTEYCVDTTIRVAFEKGFEIVVPEMTNTTYDNGVVTAEQIYELYNHRIFAGRFAELVSVEDTLIRIVG